MFKITFVYPDFESLGVEYLMALCLKAGYKTQLIFYHAENSYLGQKQKKISYYRLALKIIKSSPDLIGFSCVTDKYQYQLKLARTLKKIKPKIKIIFGGVHPTAVPKLVLAKKAVDAVAIGEADISLLNFLKNCTKDKSKNLVFPDKKIKGIVFKKNNKIIGEFTEGNLINLNILPFPYKKHFKPSKQHITELYFITTSRGCPYQCSYCFHAFTCQMRKKIDLRQRSVNNVINELLWAKEEYGIKNVIFGDDSFTTNKKWILEFLAIYKRKINLPFSCEVNPNRIDKDIIKELSLSNCNFIGMGVQSLSKRINQKVLRRFTSKKNIIKAINELKKNRIMVQADHMFGIPSDTIKNQEKAVLFYNKHRPNIISVFWLTFYPKLPIIKTALKYKSITLKDIKKINQGKRITNANFHTGGSMKNPDPYYGLQFILNYLPFLPKSLVRFLIKTRLYRFLKIKNYYLSTALPRFIHSLKDKRYLYGRFLIASLLIKNNKD